MMVPSQHPPHSLGRWGERYAARMLLGRGWRVEARNYRFGRREVDLIVRRGPLVAFVEVKTRAGDCYGSPEDAVTWSKQREIEVVAQDYLHRHCPDEPAVRFDVVGIVLDGLPPSEARVVRCTHTEGAWRPGFKG